MRAFCRRFVSALWATWQRFVFFFLSICAPEKFVCLYTKVEKKLLWKVSQTSQIVGLYNLIRGRRGWHSSGCDSNKLAKSNNNLRIVQTSVRIPSGVGHSAQNM